MWFPVFQHCKWRATANALVSPSPSFLSAHLPLLPKRTPSRPADDPKPSITCWGLSSQRLLCLWCASAVCFVGGCLSETVGAVKSGIVSDVAHHCVPQGAQCLAHSVCFMSVFWVLITVSLHSFTSQVRRPVTERDILNLILFSGCVYWDNQFAGWSEGWMGCFLNRGERFGCSWDGGEGSGGQQLQRLGPGRGKLGPRAGGEGRERLQRRGVSYEVLYYGIPLHYSGIFSKDYSTHEVLSLNTFLMKIIFCEAKTGLLIQQGRRCHLSFTKIKFNRSQWKPLYVI